MEFYFVTLKFDSFSTKLSQILPLTITFYLNISTKNDTTKDKNIKISSLKWVGHARSRDKLNRLYVHLQNTHGHETSQSVD